MPELQYIEISLNQKQNCLERLGGFAPWSPCSSLCFFFCVFLLIVFSRTWKVFRCVFCLFFSGHGSFFVFRDLYTSTGFSLHSLELLSWWGSFLVKRVSLVRKNQRWKLLVGWLILVFHSKKSTVEKQLHCMKSYLVWNGILISFLIKKPLSTTSWWFQPH